MAMIFNIISMKKIPEMMASASHDAYVPSKLLYRHVSIVSHHMVVMMASIGHVQRRIVLKDEQNEVGHDCE